MGINPDTDGCVHSGPGGVRTGTPAVTSVPAVGTFPSAVLRRGGRVEPQRSHVVVDAGDAADVPQSFWLEASLGMMNFFGSGGPDLAAMEAAMEARTSAAYGPQIASSSPRFSMSSKKVGETLRRLPTTLPGVCRCLCQAFLYLSSSMFLRRFEVTSPHLLTKTAAG